MFMLSQEYQKRLETQSPTEEKPASNDKPRRRDQAGGTEDPLAVKTQGAVLLQAILKLPSPYNQSVLDRCVQDCHIASRTLILSCSIFAQSIDDLIAIAHDVTSSRVLDVVLQSATVPFKDKRKFVMQFIGHYHTLVDDRIGSRVGDNCWAFADPYLRVRIMLPDV